MPPCLALRLVEQLVRPVEDVVVFEPLGLKTATEKPTKAGVIRSTRRCASINNHNGRGTFVLGCTCNW